MQDYIVLRRDNKDGGDQRLICFQGQRPFIGPLKKAEDLANFLKSVNPQSEYSLAKVTHTTRKGEEVKKYSGKGRE